MRQWEAEQGPHGVAHAHLAACRWRAAPPVRSPLASAAIRSRSGRPMAATSASSRRAARGTGDEAPRPQIYLMRTDGGEAWKLTDAKEGVARLLLVARQPPHRLRQRSIARSADAGSRDQEARRRARVRRRLPLLAHLDDRRRLEGRRRASPTGTTWTVRGAPSWAPDSKRLVFAAKRDDDAARLSHRTSTSPTRRRSDREDQHQSRHATRSPSGRPTAPRSRSCRSRRWASRSATARCPPASDTAT